MATFGYDAFGRRVSLTRGNGSRLASLGQNLASAGSDLALVMTHNPAGQMVGRSGAHGLYIWTDHRNGATASASNGLNQLTGLGSAALTSDAKGNLASDGTRSFAYTIENRLAASGGNLYNYDAIGRLIFAQGAWGYTYFDQLGSAIVAERAPGGTLLRRYVHGPGVDEPLRFRGHNTQFNGSVISGDTILN